MGKSKQRTTNVSDWRRQLSKKEKNICREIKEKAKICKKTSRGISSRLLTLFLAESNHFIGVFAQDEVSRITVSSFPCFLIVNLDSRKLPGSHWVAIGLYARRLEIFDPLGFDIFSWPKIPCHLLEFLLKFSVGRNVLVSKPIQSKQSTLCGFFCIFYILARNFLSFRKIQTKFSSSLSENDKLLINLF